MVDWSFSECIPCTGNHHSDDICLNHLSIRRIKMGTLYEISNKYLEILDNLTADENGEVDVSALEDANFEICEKAENVGVYIKECEALAKAIKEEELNLSVRRKALENKAQHLRAYLSDCMTMVGLRKLNTSKVAISFRTSKAVEILNEGMIPEYLMTEKIAWSPNKTAIKAAIEEGHEVPGAELVERRNIQIK